MNVATKTIVYWTVTALFCLEMSFIAYNELASPQVVEVFARLGFPGHAFQVELSVAKILGAGSAGTVGAGAAQGVGLRRLRHQPRVGAYRPLLGGRWPIRVGLGGGHRRALKKIGRSSLPMLLVNGLRPRAGTRWSME